MAAGVPLSAQTRFIENKGQWDGSVIYRAELRGGNAYIENNQVRYTFIDGATLKNIHDHTNSNPYIRSQAVFLTYMGANSNAVASSGQAFPEYYNFYIGNDPSRWKGGVNAYDGLYLKNLYSAIDLNITGSGDAIKYTYNVGQNGNPGSIALRFQGADSVGIKSDGLHIYTHLNEIIEQNPTAYQQNGNEQIAVPCTYHLDNNTVRFGFPQGYDPNLPLVIDPTVIFASYSGSTADNWGFTGTYDSLGDGYSGGTVYGIGYPTKYGLDSTPVEPKFRGGDTALYTTEYDVSRDAGILKYSPHGDTLLFATYLGGSKGNEQPHSMVVDAQDNLVVFGTTSSSDFPVTANAYQKTIKKSRYIIYVAKFEQDGKKLLAATYMGGDSMNGLNGYLPTTWFGDESHENVSPLGYNYGDIVRGEVISDNSSNIYVGTCTQSKNFPVTSGAAQTIWGGGKQDGCVFKLSPDFSKLIWSTFVGGSSWDAVFSIQLDSANNVFATGGTNSPYFLQDTGAYQKVYKGSVNGFVCKIASDGSKILHGTYIGNADYNQSYFVQLDENQNVYLYGQTRDVNFPVTNYKYINPHTGQFLAKFNNSLSQLMISTTFGYNAAKRMIPNISPSAFLVDNCGKIYISGWGGEVNDSLLYGQYKLGHGGNTKGMAITPNAYETKTSVSGSGFYVAVFATNIDTLLYGSFFGGSDYSSEEHVDGGTSRFDKRGVMYQSVCGGCGGFSNFPIPTGINVWSRTNNSSNCNNLLFKVDLGIPINQAQFTTRGFTCSGSTITFNNTSTSANAYYWNFGDGTFSNAKTPSHIYDTVKPYLVTLITTNYNSCILHDTFRENVTVYDYTSAHFSYLKQPCSFTVNFNTTDDTSATYSWHFGDGTTSNVTNPVHIYKKGGYYTITLLTDSGTRCADTFKVKIFINRPRPAFAITQCKHKVDFINESTGASGYIWVINSDTFTLANTTYQFSDTGHYLVRLIAYDSANCIITLDTNIYVYDQGLSSFTDSVPKCGGTVSFTHTGALVATANWDFGDGGVSNLLNPVHSYTQSGTYIVKLVTDSGTSCADSSTKTISVNIVKPGFSFTVCHNTVSLTNTSAGATSYEWIFAGLALSTQTNPVYTFPDTGKYLVKLIARDSVCIDTASQVINLSGYVPFFTSYTDTCSGKVYFLNKSKNVNSFLWLFGDGTTDTVANPPAHNYNSDSFFTVTLIAPPNTICADTFKAKVKPVLPPHAAFTYYKDTCNPLMQFFENSYRGYSFYWKFGEGQTDTARNPVHKFPANGNYNVTLIINKSNSCNDSTKEQITYYNFPYDAVLIPNVITPNGDGANDVFTISGFDGKCADYHIQIYNRWGELLYDYKGGYVHWNGNAADGKPLAPGTYYYLFSSTPTGEREGTITIVR